MHRKLLRGCAFGLMIATAASAHALILLTEPNVPFNFLEKGKITGLSTEVVTEMARRAGVPVTLQMAVWNQAYKTTQAKGNICLFSTARLPARERLFKWVGPIATNEWALFAKDGFTGKIDKIEDAREYRIGGVERDAKVEWLKERAVTNIVALPHDRDIPPLLTLDRRKPGFVDLWVTGLWSARPIATAAKVTDIKLVKVIRDNDLYLSCNPTVPAKTLDALQSALDAMKRDGTYARIKAPYEERFKP